MPTAAGTGSQAKQQEGSHPLSLWVAWSPHGLGVTSNTNHTWHVPRGDDHIAPNVFTGLHADQQQCAPCAAHPGSLPFV